MRFLKKTDAKKFFVEHDAWVLFKWAALSEVVGWSLLIYGILADAFLLPGASFMLPVGGSIHGMLFIAYIGILAATYSSLGWPRGKALVGFFVSALPYGTLGFELWAAKKRRAAQRSSFRRVVVRAVIVNDGKYLAIQPSNSSQWQLPGGVIEQNETPQMALLRTVENATGVQPSVGNVAHVRQAKRHGEEVLEIYYNVTNGDDFKKIDLRAIIKKQALVDEMNFVHPAGGADFEPDFLRV